MPATPVASFTEVIDTVAYLVEAVDDTQWDASTPCADWNVRQLVDHLLAGQRAFAAVMGAERPTAGTTTAETFRTSGAALVAAFAEPGALERMVHAAIGEVPGAVALHLQTVEHLVHGWDLAQAIGRTPRFEDATVEAAIEFARGVVVEAPSGPNAPFAPSRTIAEDAPAIDRLAALLGRDVPSAPPARGGKKTKVKIALAATAIIAAIATGTALAASGSSSDSGSDAAPGVGASPVPGGEQPPTAPGGQPMPDVINANGPNAFPHSLDFDAQSQTFFAGSLAHGQVYAVSPDGKVHTFIDDPQLVSAQSIFVDPERNRVLVSNVDYGLADHSHKDAPFRVAGVGSYDLATGKQQWCVDLTALVLDGKQHLISDVTVAPDGTAYAVDELTPTVFRIDPDGNASVFLRSDLLQGTLDIPDFLNDVGMSAVEWVEGNQLIIAMADGSLVRVPVDHPQDAQPVKLSAPLGAPVGGMELQDDGSITAVSSGLLTGKPAQIQNIQPQGDWTEATVTVTDTVANPVTSDVITGPNGTTYALSGGLAELLAGKPNNGFMLTPVKNG